LADSTIRSSHKTYNTYDSGFIPRVGVEGLGSGQRYSPSSSTDNIPTQRNKYSNQRDSSSERNRNFNRGYRSKTVKASKYANSNSNQQSSTKAGGIGGLLEGVNLSSEKKMSGFFDEDDCFFSSNKDGLKEH
jgi:hypothetical protein